jgi:hypothetical protein
MGLLRGRYLRNVSRSNRVVAGFPNLAAPSFRPDAEALLTHQTAPMFCQSTDSSIVAKIFAEGIVVNCAYTHRNP